jgi:hypothetical protein
MGRTLPFWLGSFLLYIQYKSDMAEHTEVSINEVQNSSDMFIGEGYDLSNPKNIPGFKQTTNFNPKYATDPKEKKKGVISKFFSNMARLGMTYDDQVVKNMRAMPADKNLIPKPEQLQNQDLFSQLSSSWKVKQNQDKNFFEKDFPQKREALRKLALQPELEDILDTMSNEAIVYDTDLTYFAEPFVEGQELNMFTKEVQEKITTTLNQSFRKFYKMLNWKYNAWDDFKRFLVEGNLAWEIVYDSLDKPKEIIGLMPLDAATLTRKFDNNKWYWIQFKGMQGKERKLLDSQVIYIAYQETNCINRVSYLERLIRPFNIYRIIEQAQLIWTITNSSYKMKFTIPVKGMNKTMGMQTVSSAMQKYKEDIKFVGDTGELTVNGQVNMPFNKEYWLPENDSGSPSIETLGGDGPELNDNDQLKYFKNQLYKISKIPLNRFDQDSGETWFGSDATSVARTEIDFARFVTRLRNTFSQIILKPLQLQIALSIPDLQENRQFLDAISLQYKSYNLFEEMMDMQLMQARVEYIQTMKESMIDMDKEGNEIKFFSSKFLVQKYLKLSDADLKLNDKLKQAEIEELNLAGDGNSEGDDDMGFGESIDYEKLSNMIVEKLSNNRDLISENTCQTTKVNKDTKKKKKTVKSKENDDSDKQSNKEEE